MKHERHESRPAANGERCSPALAVLLLRFEAASSPAAPLALLLITIPPPISATASKGGHCSLALALLLSCEATVSAEKRLVA